MNFIKINLTAAAASYSYEGYFVPRVGDTINLVAENIVGTVIACEWVHTNEITLTVKS
jgi:hypothetical protein